MLNVEDARTISPVVDWPPASDANVASLWNPTDPFLGDASALTGNEKAQVRMEPETLVGLGPQVAFPNAETVPNPRTLGMPHARLVLPRQGCQQAAQKPDFKTSPESRPFDLVVGRRRRFELRLGSFASKRPKTVRKCAGNALAGLAMIFAQQAFHAVGLPQRVGSQPKDDISSAAWEVRRRYCLNSCPASHAAHAWARLTPGPDAADAELARPNARRLQPLRHDEVGREHEFRARRWRSGCLWCALPHPAHMRKTFVFDLALASNSQMPRGARSRQSLWRRSATSTKPTVVSVRPARRPLATARCA